MRYYLIAGEKSGDMHTANLVKELSRMDDNGVFRGWGGDLMKDAGVELVHHYRDTAFMGIGAVIKNLGKIDGFLKECKVDILNFQPDVVVLIDYAGFNLKIAKFTNENNIKNFYYISPKVWAWNQKRAYKIKKLVDRMFVIMRFEKKFYAKYSYDVDYVGNPIFDEIESFIPNPNFIVENHLEKHKKIVALLPGSRKQELTDILPIMLQSVEAFPDYQFVLAGISEIDQSLYQNLPIKIVKDQTYDLLHHAHAALVTSGTATLETALFNVPQVVCYKTGALTYFFAKIFVKIKDISLANLVAEKTIVTELVQHDLTPKNIINELGYILEGNRRDKMITDYQQMRDEVRTEGASKRTAELMYKYLTQ